MVTIVIVNYNTEKFIIPCIQSIERYTPENTEVIVVDNASSDDSIEVIGNFQFQISNFKLIKNKSNLGYAKSVNLGIKDSHGDYIFVLNPDTKLTKGALDTLLKFADSNESIGVIGPKLLNPDDSLQPSCYHEPTALGAIKEYFFGIKDAFRKYAPGGSTPVQVDAVVGAAMFIPREVIDKVGMFSEQYFMYFEDLDFCRRVRLGGFPVYYLPTAKVYHTHGGVTRTVPEKAKKWLTTSSILYHGRVKHNLLTFVLWLGQKWRKTFAAGN